MSYPTGKFRDRSFRQWLQLQTINFSGNITGCKPGDHLQAISTIDEAKTSGNHVHSFSMVAFVSGAVQIQVW